VDRLSEPAPVQCQTSKTARRAARKFVYFCCIAESLEVFKQALKKIGKFFKQSIDEYSF
jgi:hypothetical protein